MNNTERLVTDVSLVWVEAEVSSNLRLSLFTSNNEDVIPTLYPVIPLKPRMHPVKVFVVIPVYVIISSSIFTNPYSEGKPFVLGTVITVSDADISSDKVVNPTTTSGTRFAVTAW